MGMQETEYAKYDLGDFAADEYFVEWVLRPDLQSDAFWTQWQLAHPAEAKKLHEARLLVLLMQSRKIRMQENQKENLWQKIQLDTIDKEVSRKNRSRRNFMVYAAAACVALLLVTLVGLVYHNLTLHEQHIVAENPAGKTSIIHLEDGTKVWLNADSKLAYVKSFEGESTRTVTLEGEAFFDVAENKDKPFIVNARQMKVKVLGTAFNVKAFNADENIVTTLLRGRVEATLSENESKPVILAENQQAVLNTRTNRISVQDVEAEKIAAWKDGILIFDNTPFSEVKISLERRYGVIITLEDQESLHCHFSGVVKDEPITKVLDLLQTTSKITYEINGTAVRLKGSLCQHSSPVP
jgi:transmembrane sensor